MLAGNGAGPNQRIILTFEIVGAAILPADHACSDMYHDATPQVVGVGASWINGVRGAAGMNISAERIGNVTVVKLAGALDAKTASILDDQLRDLIGAGVLRIILDFTNLSYIASAGIRVLYAATRQARQQSGDLRLSGLQPAVARTLELVGFVPTVKIYGDVTAALDSFA